MGYLESLLAEFNERMEETVNEYKEAVKEEEEEKVKSKKAKAKAIEAFASDHTPLSTMFYSMLCNTQLNKYYVLPEDNNVSVKEFHSRSSAKSAVRTALRKTYDAAHKVFYGGEDRRIVKDTVIFYNKKLQKCYSGFKNKLMAYCEANGYQDEFKQFELLVASCNTLMRKELTDEIDDNEYYYTMYDFDYYVDMVDIEEFDGSIETDGFLALLEGVLTNSRIYDISDIYDAYYEIESDVNQKTKSFYNAAGECFNELVIALTDILDEIGEDLPESEEGETINDYLKRVLS